MDPVQIMKNYYDRLTSCVEFDITLESLQVFIASINSDGAFNNWLEEAHFTKGEPKEKYHVVLFVIK